MIYQKDRVRYGTTTIPYHIIKTGRVKTSEVIVDADTATITVRTPLEKNKHEIQRIVLDKASWILQKQREFRKNTPQLIKPTFKENSTLPYLGKNYPLVIIKKKNEKQSENEIRLINGEFVATLKSSSKNSKSLIKNLYESWLSDNAQITLREQVEKCSQKTGIVIEGINIKNLRKRWGSLTKDKKTINLNVNLLKAPDDILDYIIIHELCHVKINDHSHHYWDFVRKYMPSYQEKIDWLNENTSILV
ncbi:MAG TPA: SprT family zinc-dependent metalloprotease [Nitrososphaeraceae archaeon]|nr:SprT family zinc-dependent metalloprotease [Nitrososphaeraceae archaeon]